MIMLFIHHSKRVPKPGSTSCFNSELWKNDGKSNHQNKRVSEYLGCSYSDDELMKLAEHVSFGNMYKNAPKQPISNVCTWVIASKSKNWDLFRSYFTIFSFYRKEKANGYQVWMNTKEIQLFDEWQLVQQSWNDWNTISEIGKWHSCWNDKRADFQLISE